ncbi:MAG: hypothetical protein ABEJ04_04695 [Halobacteriaceae archaeon]
MSRHSSLRRRRSAAGIGTAVVGAAFVSGVAALAGAPPTVVVLLAGFPLTVLSLALLPLLAVWVADPGRRAPVPSTAAAWGGALVGGVLLAVGLALDEAASVSAAAGAALLTALSR